MEAETSVALDDRQAVTTDGRQSVALDVGQTVETDTAASEKPVSFFQRRIWTRTGKVIAIVVSAVSFATGIIGVMPILLRDATGLGSLEVTAAPFEGGPQEFALSPDADLTTFPVGSACDSEQLAWLASNAEPLAHRVAVDMGNRASEGSMLALTEFRAVTAAATGDVRIRVVCETTTPNVQSARLFVDQPSATAYFGGDTLGGDGRPDSPVAWNLAPGENGTIVIDLLSATAVTGTLQLTAQSGKESTPVDVEGSDFALPGLVASGARFLLVTADGFTCQAVDGTECSVEALLAG
ncbi:hypothetical protein [Agromyces sp. NPDC058110]|uniref:hypothetical protein n=1 Tax=Agromyces sp. NPDC058110 TaxID=3346345 RepID=UPI0036DC22D6